MTKCPFYAIFHIKCPTCGVTHAMVCLLKGDINGYISFHAMALPLMIASFLALHRNLFRKKRIIDCFCIIVAVVNICYYFYGCFPMSLT